MTFYALSLPHIEEERIKLLALACKKLRIPFQTLDPFTFDFSKRFCLQHDDIVYRTSRGRSLRTLEDFLLVDRATTFYRDFSNRRRDAFVLESSHIVVPRSIACLTTKRSLICEYVKKLGGFPLVIKALGGTRGLGVMKVDSFSTLFGIVDYFSAQGKLITLREYIPVTNSARLIVLGNKVIGSLEYTAKGNDFRTNASSAPLVKKKKYPIAVERLAIKATQAMRLDFGGVDILMHGSKYYVSEVNFPCNFVRAQNVLNKDIALEMVRFLVQKAKKM